MKPTLVIMAAGIGSRYGGLKQIDPVGPSGEVVLDYSVYDAIRAEFGKVVFVIRPDIEEAFREVIDGMINKGETAVDVLPTTEKWMGVTYPEDKLQVVAGIRSLVTAEFHPENLWG